MVIYPLCNISLSSMIASIIEFIGYISNMGINIPLLGVHILLIKIKCNQYGSILIKNVGKFNINTAYAPLSRKKYIIKHIHIHAEY